MQKVIITFRRVETWKNKEIKTTRMTTRIKTTEMTTEMTTRIKRIKETKKKNNNNNKIVKGPQVEDLCYLILNISIPSVSTKNPSSSCNAKCPDSYGLPFIEIYTLSVS